MDQIRILHIIDKLSVDDSKIHGPTRQISYRHGYYGKLRSRLLVCSLRNEDIGSRFLKDRKVNVICLGRSKFNLLTFIDLFKTIVRWKPHLLHLSGYASWNFGRIAGLLTNVPVITQEHFVDNKIPKYQKTIDWCLRKLNGKSLAVSDSVKDFMINERSVEGNNIKVIGNGIPTNIFKILDPKVVQSLRKELGITQEIRVVGNVGRLALMKGHKYFLKAAKIILEKNNQIKFIIVGEGPLKQKLMNQALELGIYSDVIFAGYQDEVNKYLSLYDITVISSIFGEGFCSVGIESFASGTPVVITDHVRIKNIYVNNETVLSVPEYDADSLAIAIIKILNSPQLEKRLLNNSKKVSYKFTSEAVAAEYVQYYWQALKDSRAVEIRPVNKSAS